MSSIQCAECMKPFDWDQAYRQQDTPGSHLYNPPGHGNFRPRIFCPHCGFLVVEWDIDRYEDKNRWKWHKENAGVNAQNDLPPSPLSWWRLSVPPEACATVPEDHIDIRLVRRLLDESAPEETDENEDRIQTLSPEQIFARADQELDAFLRSRERNLDMTKQAVAALSNYVDGDGKSDANATALLGRIEYFAGNRDAAREMFDRAMSLDTSCANCYLGLGILDYWDAEKAGKGIQHLTKAITLDPSLVEAYVWKARILKQRFNDPQGAWDSLQNAMSAVGENQLEKHHQGSLLFLELGQLCIYHETGGLNEAIGYFEKSLEINPKSYSAPMYLMHIYNALGDAASAARAQAAYEKADQGVGLSNEAVGTIHRFVITSRETQIPEKSPKTECHHCGNSAFDYDSYWKEHSCRECGHVVKDKNQISLLDPINH